MISDVKLAFRKLAKTPGFTAIAILIVALGIGAATAMFSIVNTLVLRPIALPQADRLVALYETNLSRNVPIFSVSIPNYIDWSNRAKSWESLAALSWRSMNLTGTGEPQLVQGKQVTANFLPTLGIPVMLGRNFMAEEDHPGGAKVAILSEAFWRRQFGGAADIVGRTVNFDGEPYTVVGVTAAGQPFPGDLEVLIPLAADVAKESRTNHEMQIYGRLKAGVTLDEADAELKTLAAQIWNEHPEMDRGWSTRLVPFAEEIVGDGIKKALFVLLGSVGLLLLIACANLSNLLLVRASARTHELAVRTALGASRAQIIRQIVAESLTVTGVGGVFGIMLALWGIDLMHSLPLPRAGEISADYRVLGLALTVTLTVGIFAGLGPALQLSQTRPQEALKGRSPRAGHRSRLRDAMVVMQLAVSLTLLVGAALLGRSFVRLLRVNPGFNSENVLTVALRPKDNDVHFYEQLCERVAALPGVAHCGLISNLPLMEGNTSLNVFPQGTSILPTGESIQSNWRLVDGGYFSAMQIPLLHGRTFAGLSPDEALRSVVISAGLARQLWGDADPVGRQIDPGGNHRLLTVIGVVGDVRSQTLGTEPKPAFYWSMYRFIYGPMNLVVKSPMEPGSLLPAIRAAVKEIDPTVPIFRVRTLDQLRSTSLEQERLVLSLLGAFTAVALLLAALGTYGVVAFTAQQRTREIGIRLAVGAQAGDILHLIASQGFRLAGFGALLGLIGAFVASRLLSAMLYETAPADPVSYLLAAATLITLTAVAVFLPARRATRVDPVEALRSE